MPDTTDSAAPAPPDFGKSYIGWKGWTPESFGKLSRSDRYRLDAEIRKTGAELGPGSRVLEIGFGNGAFLAYARFRGWNVVGLEVNADLVGNARRAGYDAVCDDRLEQFADHAFDLVAAFDVLEHVPQHDMLRFLGEVKRVLRPGGFFVARFPNGDSPFGLPYQNGDMTHVSAIGSGKVRYLADALDVRLVSIAGEAWPLVGSSIWHILFVAPMRALTNLFVQQVFLNGKDTEFCAENLVLVFCNDKVR
jgi:SAM-dependent methyltransferase